MQDDYNPRSSETSHRISRRRALSSKSASSRLPRNVVDDYSQTSHGTSRREERSYRKSRRRDMVPRSVRDDDSPGTEPDNSSNFAPQSISDVSESNARRARQDPRNNRRSSSMRDGDVPRSESSVRDNPPLRLNSSRRDDPRSDDSIPTYRPVQNTDRDMIRDGRSRSVRDDYPPRPPGDYPGRPYPPPPPGGYYPRSESAPADDLTPRSFSETSHRSARKTPFSPDSYSPYSETPRRGTYRDPSNDVYAVPSDTSPRYPEMSHRSAQSMSEFPPNVMNPRPEEFAPWQYMSEMRYRTGNRSTGPHAIDNDVQSSPPDDPLPRSFAEKSWGIAPTQGPRPYRYGYKK